MKKTILILAAVSMIFASADAQLFKAKAKKAAPVAAPVKVFTNDVDSMSYALGINVGTDFAKNLKGIPGGKSNIDLIIKGFNTAMKGDSALMKPEVAMEFFKNYITKAQTKDSEAKKSVGEKFLTDNKTKDGVVTTASGLQYQVLVAKDGPKPAATDTVKVHYTGTLVDGTKFDSSIDRGEPISFPLNQVIPGWTEGVQLMSVGSKYKFVIPYNLGYGEKGSGPIPAFSTLIFEVELLDIKKFKESAPKVELKEVQQPKAAKPAAKKAKK
ncbi:MAG: FKBP-type peptidyl-prolyl cis-trans isomerase [Paludibacter sp.]